jgi:hypothetical protein
MLASLVWRYGIACGYGHGSSHCVSVIVADLWNVGVPLVILVGSVFCLTNVPAGRTGSGWCIILLIVVRVLHF